MKVQSVRATALCLGLVASACAGARNTPTSAASAAPSSSASASAAPSAPVDPLANYVPPRESAPAIAAAPALHLPPIARSQTPNGIEVNVVEYHTLPVLQLRLAIRNAGTAADPPDRPGLAAFVADLAKEGTRRRTSAQLAEDIEFVGGSLSVSTGGDATVFAVTVLREHAETALELLAEIVSDPSFPRDEFDKLRRRELDRLSQSQQDPNWLARVAFLRTVYGNHPYGHADATPASLREMSRDAVVNFHRAHYVTGAMVLVAVGDVRPNELSSMAGRIFTRARRGNLRPVAYPTVAEPNERRVVVVPRADSQQTVVRMGNLGVRRTSDDYVPLAVANHVLGGESSSRLFMELRERRSLTSGAYSVVRAGVEPGTFSASGSVRNEVTTEAAEAFLQQIERITREAPTDEEMSDARGFLTDSFALHMETPGDVAGLVTDLRVYQLPNDYWDTYRTRIGSVTAQRALDAARRYIHPERAVVVLVGDRAQADAAAARLRAGASAAPSATPSAPPR